jgi:hypothetical protein
MSAIEAFRVIAAVSLVFAANAWPAGAAREWPLTNAEGLTLHNVDAQPTQHHGRAAVRVVLVKEAQAAIQSQDAQARQRASARGQFPEQLAIVDGLEFGDGTIEVEIAGEAQTDLFEGARGFVGIAFRVQKDRRTYEAFYLRPTNGRANDQVRRNRSVQYISHPDGTWFRFREQAPGKYESYVDLVPGEWTPIRIEVEGAQARLFVRDASQPTLIVNDPGGGPKMRGSVALWLDIGTIAHFRNLKVTPAHP